MEFGKRKNKWTVLGRASSPRLEPNGVAVYLDSRANRWMGPARPAQCSGETSPPDLCLQRDVAQWHACRRPEDGGGTLGPTVRASMLQGASVGQGYMVRASPWKKGSSEVVERAARRCSFGGSGGTLTVVRGSGEVLLHRQRKGKVRGDSTLGGRRFGPRSP
jgi:hypothetical protein